MRTFQRDGNGRVASEWMSDHDSRAVLDFFAKMERSASPPDRLARGIEHALTAARPRTRYLVGIDARIQALLAWLLPDRARDALSQRLLGLPR